MKMKKLLKTVTLISIFLMLSTNLFAESGQELIEKHEKIIIEFCDSAYSEYGNSAVYSCILSELYGFNRTMRYLFEVQNNPQDRAILNDLFEAHFQADIGTWDFMAIHLEFEAYLKSKQQN
jgi:hypothetical protein